MTGTLKNRVASADPGGAPRARNFPPSQLASYGFVVGFLTSLMVFRVPLQHVVSFSDTSEYSYIPVVPFITAFLIFVRRSSIFKDAEPSPAIGSVILGGGIVITIVGNIVGVDSISRLTALGIVIAWCGLFVMCYGVQSARRATLPLALLLFMIPGPESVMNGLIGSMQRGSAVLSYYLFRAIGVPAIREGMAISLPRLTIDVAPECSGIRSSIGLLILTLASANLYLRHAYNKLLVV